MSKASSGHSGPLGQVAQAGGGAAAPKPRLAGIDTMRVLALVAVVLIHCEPFGHQEPMGAHWSVAMVINQLCRFAVPYFFVVSGYLWAGKFSADAWAPTWPMVRRLALLFGFWSLVYVFPFGWSHWAGAPKPMAALVDLTMGQVRLVAAQPLVALMHGTMDHLWFMPALLCSVLVTATFLAHGCQRTLVVLAVVLFGLGLLAKTYAPTPLGLHLDFNLRDGPFFGLLLFVSGYLLECRGASPRWFLPGLGLVALGVGMQFAELSLVNQRWGGTLMQDYTLGTYPLGLGVAMVALANPPWLRLPGAAWAGPLVLGMYAMHILWLMLFLPLGAAHVGDTWWELGLPLMVLLASVGGAYAMSLWRWTRALVR